MADVKAHYDNLLAPYYTWIFGGLESKLEENRNFFRGHGIRPVLSGVAMDLGAGCGFQSIPLAEAGFKVTAIDISHTLLTDLEKNARELPIKKIEDNLLNFSTHRPEDIELIVSMGDTLTHIETLDEVQLLFKNIYQALEDAGLLVLTFRDLIFELKGLDRIIPVRSESNLIFTCFLEYEKKHVKVHDVIYEKTNNQWQIQKGYYRKLRIPPDWTRQCLLKIGFEVETFDIRNGMVTIIARRQ
ncbi:MAG: class I SAM-dependent methyltransferase [Desulfobacterales bacterium]